MTENAIARDPLLVKRGEFRVASAAVLPNLGKIKMQSTDESGIARSLRRHITEVAKLLLSAAEVSERRDSLLFEDGLILVDDRDHDEQDEADQPQELRRVSAARQPTELEKQKHFQTNHVVFALWCEVCVKAKETGAQHRRQTVKEVGKQEQDGPRIYSDFFLMSEAGVATTDACVEIQQIRQNGCHSVGAEGLHPAVWSSKVQQQE